MHRPADADPPPESALTSEHGSATEQLVGIRTDTITREGRTALVVTVTGEIDLHTVGRLRTAADDGLEHVADDQTGMSLIIDLTGVTFLGSPGLDALVQATRTARRLREPLRIVVDHNRPVVRPIEMTGLDGLLALHPTLDHALRDEHPHA